MRNADAEFSQLRQALAAHGLAKSDAEVWRMVGITPEIGRNYTNEESQGQIGHSNVIFSLDDAQTVKTYAESKGIGLLAIWALGRDQPGNPNDPTHFETDSSLAQSPYQFSQIFASFGNAAPSNASFRVTQDWGTGFTGYITVSNRGATAVNGWTLEFDFAGDIYEMWSGQIVSHVGNHYAVRNASWNATIAAGQSVEFGFNANWDATHTSPSNYLLNGVAIGG
jgi:hypothetical protein